MGVHHEHGRKEMAIMKAKIVVLALASIMLFVLIGCGGPRPSDQKETTPGSDTTAPRVVSVTTTDGKNLLAGGVMVGPSDTIVVRLSENADASYVSGVSVRIQNGATVSSTATASVDSIRVVGSLSYALTYELVMSGVRDSAGNVMPDYVLAFKTFPYAVNFWVTDSSPASGVTVPDTEVARVRFNNPVNLSTLTTANFAVSGSAYTLSLSSDGLTAYATPTAAGWPAGSRTISLSNIGDIYGNTMAPTSWSFTSSGGSSSSPFTWVPSGITTTPGASAVFMINGPSSGVSCTVVNAPVPTTPTLAYGSSVVYVTVPTSPSVPGFYETICSAGGETARMTVVATTTADTTQTTLSSVLNLTPGTTAAATFNSSTGALNVTSLGSERWHIQLFETLPTLVAGAIYEVEFVGSGGCSMDWLMQNSQGPYTHYDDANRAIPCDGTVRILHFRVPVNDSNARLSIMPRDTGTCTFTYIKWRRVL